MRRISKLALVGFAIGIINILYSIKLSGDLSTFLNWPSVFITIGGTLGAVVVSFPWKRLKTLGAVMKKAFVNDKYDLKKDIDTIVALSEVFRREGLLALEEVIDQYTDDEFLKKGVLLLVDGADKDQLRTLLQSEIYFTQQRHRKGHAMLDMIASTAPSLGLLGTYIGLIPMLQNLEDPTKLGPLMAIELVTSFYGAFLAYIIFAPMSRRLKAMSEDEITRKELIIEGLTAIQEGKNPRIIRAELITCISKQDAKGMSQQRLYEPEMESEMKPKMKKVINFEKR